MTKKHFIELRHGTPGAFGKCHYVIDYRAAILDDFGTLASRGPRPNTWFKVERGAEQIRRAISWAVSTMTDRERMDWLDTQAI